MADACPSDDVLAAYLGGEATDLERDSTEAHMDGCETCRLLVAGLADSDEGGQSSRLGRYGLGEVVGTGAMGVVYSAYDPELDRDVALKVLRSTISGSSKTDRGGIRREARAIARLNHPNIISIYDVGREGDEVFIAMELVSGGTLRQWLENEPPQEDIVAAFRQAGEGLAAAHAAGLVHRDFKLDNVLVTDDGIAKVSDFGLARLGRESVTSAGLPQSSADIDTIAETGVLLGTPVYMGPELFEGGEASEESDQYAFCVALSEALTGERPFTGKNFDELRKNITAGRRRELDETRVPRRVRRVIDRGLSLEPADRFPSMAELLAALRPPSRRLPLFIAGVALTVGAVIAAVVIGSHGESAADVCAEAGESLASSWNTERRSTLEREISRSELPSASTLAKQLDQRLDSYAEVWKSARRESCLATYVTKSQDIEALEREHRCLDRGRHQMDALVSVLVDGASSATVMRSLGAASELPSPSACLGADGHASGSAAASPAESRARKGLAKARARFDLGDFAGTIEMTDRANPELSGPLLAEGLYLKARALERRAKKPTLIEAAYKRAIEAAARARDDILEAEIRTTYAMYVGYWQSRVVEGRVILEAAQASRLRAGLAADSPEGRVAEGHFKYRESISSVEDFEAALRLLDERGETTSVLRASVERDLGLLLSDQKRLLAAFEMSEKMLGVSHPDLGAALINLSHLAIQSDSLERAAGYLERALAIRLAAHGRDHPRLAPILTNIGWLHAYSRRTGEARATIAAAMEIMTNQRLIESNSRGAAELACAVGDHDAGRVLLEAAGASPLSVAPALCAEPAVPIPMVEGTPLRLLSIAIILDISKRQSAARAYARAALAAYSKLPDDQQKLAKRVAKELGVD